MQFRTRKTFGPRINLTEIQIAKVTAEVETAGFEVDCENCQTGSCYVTLFERTIATNIRGEEFNDKGDEVAKIRLSGHDEGKRQDSTHNCVGTKSECLKSLKEWIARLTSPAVC